VFVSLEIIDCEVRLVNLLMGFRKAILVVTLKEFCIMCIKDTGIQGVLFPSQVSTIKLQSKKIIALVALKCTRVHDGAVHCRGQGRRTNENKFNKRNVLRHVKPYS
jgi:hypothetical protein